DMRLEPSARFPQRMWLTTVGRMRPSPAFGFCVDHNGVVRSLRLAGPQEVVLTAFVANKLLREALATGQLADPILQGTFSHAPPAALAPGIAPMASARGGVFSAAGRTVVRLTAGGRASHVTLPADVRELVAAPAHSRMRVLALMESGAAVVS